MSSSSSSSSASKKELLGAAAGEFASTLFERLKKSAERKNNTNNSANSPSPHSGASTSSTTANVISNLAQNLLADNSGGSGGGISFSKLLNDQLNKNKNSNNTTQIVKIYDDDDLDDDNFDVAKMPDMTVKKSQQQQSAVPTSKSEMNMNALINKSNDSTNSSTNSPSESASSKMSTSSSLHRLGSVLDDILKSDLANSMVDTAAREAESLRRGILTKKKSIELSLESMKSRTRSSSKLINSPDSDHATATSTPTSATETVATDSTTPSSLLITTDEDQESDNKKQLPESTATSTATASNNINKSESSKKDDEMSNTTKTTENQNQTESVNLDDTKVAETRSSLPPQQSSNVDETSSSLESERNKTKPVNNDQTQKPMLLSDKRLIGGTIAVAVVFGLILGKNLSFVVLSFLFGITFGAALTASVLYLAYKYDLIKYIIKPTQPNSIDNRVESVNSAETTSSQLQSLLIQTAIKKENKNFDGVYRGWMNELREVYDPENYFLNKTRSVYLNLDGVVLRIQTTTSRIPKRAVAGENIGTVQFNEQRHYDLTDCEVVILPTRLCRKRYWSKKYPICLKGVKLLGTKGGITTTASSSSLQQTEAQSNTPTSASNNSSNLLREESTASSSELDMNTLVLFGRTDREKEEWFNLFCKASAQKLNDSMYYLKMKRSKQTPSPPIARPVSLNEKIGLSFDVSNNKIIYKMLDEEPSTSKESKDSKESKENKENTDQPSESSSSTNQLAKESQTDTGLLYDTSLALFNTFVIRMFTDVFTHHDIIERIQSKIQNKLSKIDVPYFMEELRVTGLDLGSVVPLVKQTTEPWYDERGLWVHMDIDYSGGLQLSLSTKLNLMKLKSNTTHHHHLHQLPPQQSSTHQHQQQPSTPTNAISTSSSVPVFTFKNETSSLDDAVLTSNLENRFSPAESMSSLSSSPGDAGLIGLQQTDAENSSSKGKKKRSGSVGHHIASKSQRKKTLGAYDSNEEDSPESSGDEYVHTGFLDEENKLVETANASKKLLGFVTKIASSDYFQKATENKYIKKAMENVSNCQLLLNVELKKIVGTIALNIPPHPSDRIWYGFVSSPQMVLVATPQVGEKEVSYSAITDWIADKLKQEFQKVLVFPNMDDFYIPIMKSELEFKNK